MPIERMKTPGSRKWSASRMRSPSSAPCENGLDGSTETTPTVRPSARTWRSSAPIRLDLPTPGGPVTPIAYALAGLRVEVADELVRERVGVLDERDRPRERAAVAGAHARDERLARPLAPGHRQLCADSERQPARARTPASGAASRSRSSAAARRDTPPRSAHDPARPDRVDERARRATIPSPSTAKFELMISVNARPRSVVGRTALDEQRVADDRGPVPDPAESEHQTATQTFGRHRGGDVAERPSAPIATPCRRRTCSAARARTTATEAPTTRPSPLAAHISPKPKSPASNETFGEHDLGHVDERDREHGEVPRDEHGHQRARAADEREARRRGRASARGSRHGPAWSSRAGIADEQDRRDDEAGRVQRVGEVGAGRRRRRRRRAACRTSIVRWSAAAQQRVRARQRPRPGRGSAARRRRRAAKKPGGEAGDERRARRSATGSTANGEQHEDGEPERGRRRPAAACRESRSTSGPSRSPIATAGRKSAIRSALTQTPECVRS